MLTQTVYCLLLHQMKSYWNQAAWAIRHTVFVGYLVNWQQLGSGCHIYS